MTDQSEAKSLACKLRQEAGRWWPSRNRMFLLHSAAAELEFQDERARLLQHRLDQAQDALRKRP